MSTDLKEQLQTIDGIGPTTADKIMGVFADHNTGSVDDSDLESLLAMLERGSAHVAKSRLEQLLTGEK